MIIIPGDILEVKLGAAVTTKQLSYNISYSDNGIITSKHGFTYNTSNIALHPTSDYNITILSFTITNLDSVAATVKIQINKAPSIFNTRTVIFTALLAPGEALQYDGDNFIVPTVAGGGVAGSLSAGTATMSLGQAVFSNSNGVSFGITGQTITASINSTAGAGVNFSAGTTSNNLTDIRFQNSNGVSFGLNGSTITASISALSTQSNQALSGSNGSFTFQTATFGNLNGLSFYTSNGSIVGSYTQSTHSHSSLVFSNSNNITFGIAGSTVTASASYTVPTVTNSSWTASAGTTSGTVGQLEFANSNGISFGLDNGTITATVKTDYQSSGNYLTTAMQSDAGSNFMGTNTAITQNGVSMTANSSGLSLNFPAFLTTAQPPGAYLTTAALSQDSSKYAGTNGAITGGSITVNTDGVSVNLPAYLTTAQPVGAYLTTAMLSNAATISNIKVSAGTLSTLRSDLSFDNSNGVSFGLETNGVITATVATNYQSQGAYLTTAMASNRGSDFVQATAAFAGTNASGTIASNGISVSVNAGGAALKGSGTYTQNTGTIEFANSNGITFGLSNNGTMTASHNGLTTAMASNRGSDFMGTNTALTANGVSMTANSSGLSLNFPAFLTTAQPVGAYLTTARASNDAIGLNTALTANGVAWTVNSSGLSLNIPAFLTTAALSDHSHGNPTLALTNLTGTTASASNGFTLSLSAASPAAGVNIAAGTRTATTAGNLLFDNANGITFGLDAVGGSVMTASHNALTTARASNDAIGLNTAQSNVTWTVNSSGLSLDARGYAGTGTSATNASITLNSNGLAISVAAPGAGGGIALANSQTTYTSGTANLVVAGGAMTIASTTGQSFNFSVPQTSSLSATGQVSISVNGSTISIGVPNKITLDGHLASYMDEHIATQVGQSTLYMQPLDVQQPFQFDKFVFPAHFSNATNSSNSASLSMAVGIYTRTGQTLSLMHSSSQSYAYTASGTAGSYSLAGGVRNYDIPWTSTLTEGNYWVGLLSRTTTGGGAGMTWSNFAVSQMTSIYSGRWGSANNASNQRVVGQGSFSVQTAALPASISLSNIRGSAGVAFRPLAFYFQSN